MAIKRPFGVYRAMRPRLLLPFFVAFAFALLAAPADACRSCRPLWQALAYNEAFFPTLLQTLIPVAGLGLVAFGLARIDRWGRW